MPEASFFFLIEPAAFSKMSPDYIGNIMFLLIILTKRNVAYNFMHLNSILLAGKNLNHLYSKDGLDCTC